MRLAKFAFIPFFALTAQAADADLQRQIFGHVLAQAPGYACFTRVYTPSHLASHPKQNVTSIMLLIKGMAESDVHYTATVDFRFRKSGKHYQATGDCPAIADAKGNALHCGIECDGGMINVNLKDADTLMVKLPDAIAVTGSGANDAPDSGRFGSDDKVFKLTRTTGIDCLGLTSDEADQAGLKAAP